MSGNLEIVERTLDRIRERESEFAASFYKNMFTDYPQMQPFFANTNMEGQKKMLIIGLVMAIKNLHNTTYLKTLLQHLGERHVKYGTKPEHYPLFNATLFKTLESYLGTDWTPEVKQAWADALAEVIKLMVEGANNPE